MRTFPWITAVAVAATLTGCVTYPVYQPTPLARLTPAQSAALAAQPIDPAEKDRYARAAADVQRQDQADLENQRQAAMAVPYTYAYPAPYSYGYYGYGYPSAYYGGGFYPWYPGISLSFGYRGGFGGYRGGYYGGGHRGGGGHFGGGRR